MTGRELADHLAALSDLVRLQGERRVNGLALDVCTGITLHVPSSDAMRQRRRRDARRDVDRDTKRDRGRDAPVTQSVTSTVTDPGQTGSPRLPLASPSDSPPEQNSNNSARVRASKGNATRRWRRVPEAWEPGSQHRDIAASLGVDFDLELATFRDHEFQTAKSDPDATFRNWIRRARPSLDPLPAPNSLSRGLFDSPGVQGAPVQQSAPQRLLDVVPPPPEVTASLDALARAQGGAAGLAVAKRARGAT